MLAAVARSLEGATPRGAGFYSQLGRCRREYFYREIEKLEPLNARARRRTDTGGGLEGGSLLHATLAAYHEIVRVSGSCSLEELRPHFEEAVEALEAAGVTEFTQWGVVERYLAWEGEALRHWKTVGVEIPMEVNYNKWGARAPIVHVTCKIYRVVKDSRTGETFAIDYKFAASERVSIES